MLKIRLIALLFTVSTFLSGCISANNLASMFTAPQVQLTSLTPRAIDKGNLAFDIGLKLHNPNAIALPISDITSNIALNGLQLLSATGRAQNAIPANGSEDVMLTTSLNPQQIQQLLSTINSQRLHYDLNGRVGVMNSSVSLPFKQKRSVDVANLATKLLRAQLGQ